MLEVAQGIPQDPPKEEWLARWEPLIDAVSNTGFWCGRWPGGTAKAYQQGPMLEAETAKAALITELRKTVAPIDWTAIDARLDKAVQALGWNKAMGEIRAILREVANASSAPMVPPPAPASAAPLPSHLRETMGAAVRSLRYPGSNSAVVTDDDRRMHIEALLNVYPGSRASVCRLTGVSPAALTRFLQAKKGGQISMKGQLALLGAMGWPEGCIDPQRVHFWRVQSLDAAQWLLSSKSAGQAQLAAVAGAPHLMIGQFGEAPLLLRAWGGVRNFNRLLSDATSKPWRGTRSLTLADGSARLLSEPGITPALFRAAIDQAPPTAAATTHRIHDLAAELAGIGLDHDTHYELLLDWLTRRCNSQPDQFRAAIRRLESLTLPEGRIPLQSLTEAQMERLIKRLEHRIPGVMRANDSALADSLEAVLAAGLLAPINNNLGNNTDA